MIIALSGYAKSGKDTVADILVEEFGFTKFSFAAKIKEAVVALDPIIRWDSRDEMYEKLSDVMCYQSLSLDEAKLKHPEVRRLLQRMGTEVGRKIFGEDFWVELILTSPEFVKADKCVISDCRFPNEADEVNDLHGGQVWRINRPSIVPANDHISEVGLDNYPFNIILNNIGSIEDLRKQVRETMHASSF